MDKQIEAFKRLLCIMNDLREKCPWDRVQTMDSMRTLTIEEVYELTDAILEHNMDGIKEELGDVLLHIVFYSKIASETNDFDIADVINNLCEKLIYRHPHIYGEIKVKDGEEVKTNWEKLKLRKGKKGLLSGVPQSLPALVKANRIQDKVRSVGFDWDDKSQVWDKVNEELGEVKQEINKGDAKKMESEFGDLLFSVVNAARLYNVDPESALERTNKKFMKRFNHLEKNSLQSGKTLKEMSLEEMNSLWEEAKKFD
ncbi:MAG: nucleoside triphosphate pyrophosphohydrolase [Bacteroidota bacterium]|nr:nucleoside triphosphate pyrophosphohydrolase [Bacteroidota bacterium]